MPPSTPHPQYTAALPTWQRARDIIAGEDAVKGGGEKYLPKLIEQRPEDYAAYRDRASFFNATARTLEGYVGLVFRRPPFVKLPDHSTALGKALAVFENDADMFGTPLATYAKAILNEVIAVGRCGTLLDWEGEAENRVYVGLYTAENILNWRVERINGRNLLTLLALYETAMPDEADNGKGQGEGDPFAFKEAEQIRVLRLVPKADQPGGAAKNRRGYECRVEVWRKGREQEQDRGGTEGWVLVETRTPRRLGKALPLIPFVLHGPRHFLPDIEKLPLADVIAVNLDHYRLDADYKHGMHFTALPTAWVVGFDPEKDQKMRIGSSTAWVSRSNEARCGFLEYTGQGLATFERAMDRDERLMAVLGARLLEGQKKVGETAEAIELRQSGENSVLSGFASSVSASLTHVLRWAYWWNSTEELPDDVTSEQVLIELNTDFSTKGLSPQEIQAVVAAWQANAISREAMVNLFRRGEVLE